MKATKSAIARLAWCVLLFLSSVATLPALAASTTAPASPVGTWVLRAGGKSIFRLQIKTASTGWSALWSRPDHYDVDGDSFKKVSGPTITLASISGSEYQGWIEFRFRTSSERVPTEIFRIHLTDSGTAEVHYNGQRLGPLYFERDSTKGVFGGWNPEAVYRYNRSQHIADDPSMTLIFDADASARSTGIANNPSIREDDEKRRTLTKALIDAGKLSSGNDFFHAAIIFQHGSSPQDFLLAHILASASVARGNSDAIWIVAASLDRYLQSIGQPQVLGTQFRGIGGQPTQEPFDKDLISDALRAALHVPSLVEQEEQRQVLEDSTKSAK
ncbi:MAG: hypothetical protein P0Y59_00445 [Candidatus Sphingomonas phytovorans]|nr:hypothetical protein [Sphingomonas sp.]WEK00204.1 MAG: hypothetical protein P0Y59_00445 [Sphingomonas sp.]